MSSDRTALMLGDCVLGLGDALSESAGSVFYLFSQVVFLYNRSDLICLLGVMIGSESVATSCYDPLISL